MNKLEKMSDIILVLFFISQIFYFFLLDRKFKEKMTDYSSIPKNDKRFKNLEIVSNLITEMNDTSNNNINFKSNSILGNNTDQSNFDYESPPTKIILKLNNLKFKENTNINNIQKII